MTFLRSKKANIVISLTLVLVLSLSFLSPVASATSYSPDLSDYSSFFRARLLTWPDRLQHANSLYELGLFKGTGSGFELDREPTRMEALVTVIRLIGKEDEALNQNLPTTFEDVPSWATAYAGFSQANGISFGISDSLYGSQDAITAQQYLTLLLRILGYSDQSGDFSYEKAIGFSSQIGLLTDRASFHYEQSDVKMLRGDMAYLIFHSLRTPSKNGELLITTLSNNGIINEKTAYGSLIKNNESESEIRRALMNGYCETWYSDFKSALSSNSNIPSNIKPLFENYLYEWLKEPAMEEGYINIKNSLSRLTLSYADREVDREFRNSPSTLAYFQVPNKMVVCTDVTPWQFDSAVSHELRHAITSNLVISSLEEGMTSVFTKDANDALFGYDYYYTNVTRLITHMIGSFNMNYADLRGSNEEIYYFLEKSTGIKIDKPRFSSYLESSSAENSSQVMEFLFTLLKGYYENNMDEIIDSSLSEEHFCDTLISLLQLLYYPSCMERYTESDLVLASPSGFYSQAAVSWAKSVLERYSEMTGESSYDLLNYYERNKDIRYSIPHYGQYANNVLVRNALTFDVVFKEGNQNYIMSFGTQKLADLFSSNVNFVAMERRSNYSFSVKQYY